MWRLGGGDSEVDREGGGGDLEGDRLGGVWFSEGELRGWRLGGRVCKKHNSLKKANISRLKWIKPDKILCFFKGRVFSKMRHRSTSYDHEYDEILII